MKFTRQRLAAPQPVLTMEEARLQLRVDTFGSPPGNPEDPLIAAAITTATEELDAGTGWLGRAIGPQTWRLSLDCFPSVSRFSAGFVGRIRLPFPPFIAVTSFEYTNTDGDTVALVEGTDFRVIAGDEDGSATLYPVYQGAWPVDVRQDFDVVRIVFRCGYSDGASPESPAVPELIKNWLRARVTDIYDTRGTYDNAVSQRNQIIDAGGFSLNSVRVWDYEP